MPDCSCCNTESTRDRRLTAMHCAALAIAVALAFGQTVGYDFVNYDDHEYLVQNPHVTHGLNLRGAWWAFTTHDEANWHPLTWLSHILDCQLYGLWAGGHHLTNVVLHAANAVMLRHNITAPLHYAKA